MTVAPEAAVLAVDGGGSKTDVLAIGVDGAVLARARGAGSNPQTAGWETVRPRLDALRSEVLGTLADRRIATTHVYLAGLDLPDELDVASLQLAHWAGDGGAPDVLDNDLFALLRAGTLSPDAVVVVCGTGMNAMGVRADGETARFPALGDISGDLGGGAWLGMEALRRAARAWDGRGPATSLTASVPATFGLGSVQALIEELHFGRIPRHDVGRLSPVLMRAAEEGDAVALGVVAVQAEEIATMAATTLRRLGLLDAEVPLVLGGGVLAARSPVLVDALLERLERMAPGARPVWVTAPPVLGAGLAALESVGAPAEALTRFREELGG